jgi:3-phenylpropionate/trans-cinnamate dioxygenase ferredoxin component
MAAFVDVAAVRELPPGTGRTFHVRDKEIAIFNVDGQVYAIDDSCVHAGASLGAGKLDGKVLTCRAHGFRYDVTTGQLTTGGLGVTSYPAKVSDGRIFVAVE